MNSIITVLIIEDSALMRRELSRIINSDPQCQVVGMADSAEQGLEKVKQLKPDVVTLDINLPGMDGLTCLQYIMLESPRPCVIISAYTGADSVETFEALELGAVDFIQKPSGEISRDIGNITNQLTRRIKAASKANLRVMTRQQPRPLSNKKPTAPYSEQLPDMAVVIGVSTGGPRTLMRIIPALPADIGVPILIIQHMPAHFTGSFARRLNDYSALPVTEAQHGQSLANNMAYVAPGGYNLTAARRAGGIYLQCQEPLPDQVIVPSVDLTLKTAIDVWGRRLVGVILTGMGNDGQVGMQRLDALGGQTLAESEETAIIYGMPKAVVDCGAARQVVPSHRMAEAICDAVSHIRGGLHD